MLEQEQDWREQNWAGTRGSGWFVGLFRVFFQKIPWFKKMFSSRAKGQM